MLSAPEPVDAEDVRPLRHSVLRPTQGPDALVYPGDALPGALHLAIRDGDAIVAVGSISPEPHPHEPADGDWRVRGMATDPALRGQGVGAQVLRALLAHARASGGRRIWCNARVAAESFYAREGFAIEGESFVVEPIGEHYLMTDDLAAYAKRILAANAFAVLGTADAGGRPWTTPVWFALDGASLLWISDPGARHSRNVAERAEVSAVVYDSTVVPGAGEAVYLEASAQKLEGDAIDAAIAAYSAHGAPQGLPAWSRAQVDGDARHRIYRATVTQAWVLAPGHRTDTRVPVEL